MVALEVVASRAKLARDVFNRFAEVLRADASETQAKLVQETYVLLGRSEMTKNEGTVLFIDKEFAKRPVDKRLRMGAQKKLAHATEEAYDCINIGVPVALHARIAELIKSGMHFAK